MGIKQNPERKAGQLHRLTMCRDISLSINAFQVSQWLLSLTTRRLGRDKTWEVGRFGHETTSVKSFIRLVHASMLPRCSTTQNRQHVPSLQCFWMVISYLHRFRNIKCWFLWPWHFICLKSLGNITSASCKYQHNKLISSHWPQQTSQIPNKSRH